METWVWSEVTILFVLIHDFHVEDANAALQFLNELLGCSGPDIFKPLNLVDSVWESVRHGSSQVPWKGV